MVLCFWKTSRYYMDSCASIPVFGFIPVPESMNGSI